MRQVGRLKVDTEKCNVCGLCLKDCPTGSMVKDSTGVVKITEGCVSCGVCLNSCARNAIIEVESTVETAGCEHCPIFCKIPAGKLGACQRYSNKNGVITRTVPLHVVDNSCIEMDKITGLPTKPLLLGVGSGTTLYTTNTPARFMGGANLDGVEVVTAVTESVLSFGGVKLKIDTDENLGSIGSKVRHEGRVVGLVTPSEYGSRTMYIGGVEQFSKKSGHTAARVATMLLNGSQVVLSTDTVKELVVQLGQPPIVDGKQVKKMRVGCGSAIVESYAVDWLKVADEVIAVDYDITAFLSQHPGCVRQGSRPTGVTPAGSYSSPGRRFGTPGKGWGGSNICRGSEAIASIDKNIAWPGLRIVVTEPTAERAAYLVLNDDLEPVEKPIPSGVEEVLNKIRKCCEPSLTNVTVVGGIGGGVRDILTRTEVTNVNKAVKEGTIKITICGKPANILPGGNIIVEADVADMIPGSFAWVPTPALVVPLEFTMTKETCAEIGGFVEAIEPVEKIIEENDTVTVKV